MRPKSSLMHLSAHSGSWRSGRFRAGLRLARSTNSTTLVGGLSTPSFGGAPSSRKLSTVRPLEGAFDCAIGFRIGQAVMRRGLEQQLTGKTVADLALADVLDH